MQQKNLVRKKYYLLRKKKYFEISKIFFNPLLSLIKSKIKKNDYIIALYYPTSFEVNILKLLEFNHISNKNLLLPNVRKNSRHVFHIFAILTKKRKLLIEYLNKHKVTPGIHYSKPACLNNGYSELCKFQLKDIKKTIKISRETLSLPIYPELTNYDINKVIKLINKFK